MLWPEPKKVPYPTHSRCLLCELNDKGINVHHFFLIRKPKPIFVFKLTDSSLIIITEYLEQYLTQAE